MQGQSGGSEKESYECDRGKNREQLMQDICGIKKLIYNMVRKAKRGDSSATLPMGDRERTLKVELDDIRNRRRSTPRNCITLT